MSAPLPATAVAAAASPPAALARAVLAALSYSDVFDHPLTPAELHRYLPGVPASPQEVEGAVGALLATGRIAREGGFLTLAGRADLAATRVRRSTAAARLWPVARRWGRWIAALPFVRLVAVTGSLAVEGSEAGDIDLLVVAARGRLWTCRALVTLAARLGGIVGTRLCPNTVLDEDALAFPAGSLYVARDLVQAVPLAGLPSYARLRAANAWADALLPNAAGAPPATAPLTATAGQPGRTVERWLGGRFGEAVERRLGALQRRRLTGKVRRGRLAPGEAAFSAVAFRGYFDGHGRRVMAAYAERLAALVGTRP